MKRAEFKQILVHFYIFKKKCLNLRPRRPNILKNTQKEDAYAYCTYGRKISLLLLPAVASLMLADTKVDHHTSVVKKIKGKCGNKELSSAK